MKNILKFFAASLLVGALVPMGMTSCTDMDGDGIDSVVWEGSTNPENKSYRNPVWEPSAEGATLIKGASQYAIVGATTQWAPNLDYYGPIVTTTDLMSWSKHTNEAFSTPFELTPNKMKSVGGDYAKSYSGNKYWIFYTVEGENNIYAASATTAVGPYVEYKKLDLTTTTEKVEDPFFLVVSKNYYLFYSTEKGTYFQELTLSISKGVITLECKGDAVLLTGPDFHNVSVYYAAKTDVYLYGTVGNEIRYARASALKGPYLDKAGVDLAAGGNGELLVKESADYKNPENPMRGFTNSDDNIFYLAFNATEVGNETMKSGYNRRPMFVLPTPVGEDGWYTEVLTPVKGWTSPRYE